MLSAEACGIDPGTVIQSALREYLEAWRWELVWAIRRQEQAEDLAS